eukprot:g1658.t1
MGYLLRGRWSRTCLLESRWTSSSLTTTAAGTAEDSMEAERHQHVPKNKAKTGILMLNMGGPSHPDDTQDFLRRLFQDSDIIELGGGRFQDLLGKFISKRRTPKVKEQYETIGGSPIRKWTEYQGQEMCRILDETRPESAPHRAYTAFRYANPLTEEALKEMEADGVERAIAFSQFPQWSCTTSGSSMNELWREVRRMGLTNAFKWSVIDRWPVHDGFVQSVTERIEEKMQEFKESDRENVVILFSAHSVPMKVVERGDQYVPEVAATVKAVMDKIGQRVTEGSNSGSSTTTPNKYILGWQSKVGYVPWMVPSTEHVIKSLGKRGTRHVLVVPIAFTSDHIETLFEIGHEYAEVAEEVGIKNFKFTEGLNGSKTFCNALADIVQSHLESKSNHSPQYKMKCVTCVKPLCRKILNPANPDARAAIRKIMKKKGTPDSCVKTHAVCEIASRCELGVQITWFNVLARNTTFSWRDADIDRTHTDPVDASTKERLEREARQYWDLFYKENETRFYKDRHYLHKVFPGIVGDDSSSSSPKKKTLLEIGCGVGNAFLPLLRIDPSLSVLAVDLSSQAIDLIKKKTEYLESKERCSVFVCNVTKEPLPAKILQATVDNVLVLFVLSAISPDDMLSAMKRAVEPLRSGGKLFFRDFARGDTAQLRFGPGHKLGENFYARQDGTRAYFFTLEEVRKLFDLVGLDTLELSYIQREQQNGKMETQWTRTWVHGIFQKRAE